MGGEFQEARFKAATRQEAMDLATDEFQEARSDNGDGGYSGSFAEKSGVTIVDKGFKSADEALDYSMEYNDKWGDAYLSPINPVKQTKKHLDHTEKLRKLQKEYDEFDANVLAKAKQGKSKTKSCKGCNTRYVISNLRLVSANGHYGFSKPQDFNCPNCSKTFLSETDLKKKESLQKRRLKEKDNVRESAKTFLWVLSGWCSS